MKEVFKFRCSDTCCCPTLHFDEKAKKNKQYIISDDFGNAIKMSKEQLKVIEQKIKEGCLDNI